MTVKNLEASVQARLQNRARAAKRPYQELLQYYAMERPDHQHWPAGGRWTAGS